jgi:hypothetical protein
MSDPILIPSTSDGSPVGPTNSVDMVVAAASDPSDSVNMSIVASAAKVAADAALADTAITGSTSFSSPRRSRPKIVSAKSVLLGTPKSDHSTKASKRGKDNSRTKSSSEPQRKKTKKSTPTKAKKAKASPVKSPSKSKSKSKPETSGNGVTSALEVFSGVPNEKFEYSWDGWTKKTFKRQSGKTKGSTDSYWYTPKMKYKLRSLTEVKRFHICMENNKNDEELAYKAFKQK